MDNSTLEIVKEYSKNIEDWKQQNRTLWSHPTLVNATILGFSVATTQIKNIVNPNLFLVLAWILLIASVALGIVLLKEDQDLKFSGDLESFQFKYNLTEIENLFSQGEIDADQRKGMIIATLGETKLVTPAISNMKFTKLGEEYIEKYKDKLPTAKFLVPIKGKKPKWDNPVKKWILTHNVILSNWIYYLSFAAYLALLLSVLTGPYFSVLLSKSA